MGEAVDRLREDRSVLGILQVGSSVTEFADEHSDIDLEVVVDDDRYLELEGNTFVPAGEGVEVLLMSKSEFLAKRTSPRDLDHSSYEGCVVHYDPDGILARELPRITALPEADRELRVLLHYWEFLAQARRVQRLASRDSELDARVVTGFALWSVARVLYVSRGRWPPVVHWCEEGIAALSPSVSAELSVAMHELARSAGARAAGRVIDLLDAEVRDAIGDFAADRAALTARVYDDEMRPVRERYGMR